MFLLHEDSEDRVFIANTAAHLNRYGRVGLGNLMYDIGVFRFTGNGPVKINYMQTSGTGFKPALCQTFANTLKDYSYPDNASVNAKFVHKRLGFLEIQRAFVDGAAGNGAFYSFICYFTQGLDIIQVGDPARGDHGNGNLPA